MFFLVGRGGHYEANADDEAAENPALNMHLKVASPWQSLPGWECVPLP